jgi:hypothetical protein
MVRNDSLVGRIDLLNTEWRRNWLNWTDQMGNNCICRSLAPADRILHLRRGSGRPLTDLSTQPFTLDT